MQRLGVVSAHGLLLVAALAVFPPIAHASICDMLFYSIDDARSKLTRAAKETDLESAKDYARRAKSALEDAAMAAMDCECDMAYSEFDTAASLARRARDADDFDAFVDSLNRSIRSFNAGLEVLDLCPRSQ